MKKTHCHSTLTPSNDKQLKFYEGQRVYYLDSVKQVYTSGLFKCYLRNDLAKIVPENKFLNDVIVYVNCVRP